MKWESLDLHLENLFPGLVTFYLLLAVLPEATLCLFVIHRYPIGEYLGGGVFLAASYIVGAIAVGVSRFVVDQLSECSFRPLMLRYLSHGSLREKSNKEANQDYRDKIRQALISEKEIIKKEVTQRRERGRLVRTALIPLMLTVPLATSSFCPVAIIVFELMTLAAIVFLYSYVELTIYEECLFAVNGSQL